MSTAPGTANCLGFWKLNDDADSSTVIDSSSNGTNGILSNNQNSYTSEQNLVGKINGGFGFTNNCEVDLTDITLGNTFSLSFWFYNGNTGAPNNFMVSKGTFDGNTEFFLAIHQDGVTLDLRTYWGTADGSSTTGFHNETEIGVGISEWGHVVITRDGSTASLYVNGSNLYNWTELPATVYNGSASLLLADVDGSAYPFVGKLDCVILFDKELSQDEVDWLYNSGDGTEDLVGFSELSGTGSMSFSGSSNVTGTWSISGSSSLLFSGSSNITGTWQVSGNSALSFDGNSSLTHLIDSFVGTSAISFSGVPELNRRRELTGTGAVVCSGTTVLTRLKTISGTSSILFSPNAVLNGTWSISGTSSIVFDGSADLTDLDLAVLTAALIFSGSGSLLRVNAMIVEAIMAFSGSIDELSISNIPEYDSPITYKRLIAAGNDSIYYEDI